MRAQYLESSRPMRVDHSVKVTLEVLSYHSSATTHDLAEVEQLEKISTPINVRALAAYGWSVPVILNYQLQPLGSPTTGPSSQTTARLTKWSPCSTISSGRRDLNRQLWSGNFSLLKFNLIRPSDQIHRDGPEELP